MMFHWACGDNNRAIVLLPDFEFQCFRVNFFELRSVVARLGDSVRYVRERTNHLGRCCIAKLISYTPQKN